MKSNYDNFRPRSFRDLDAETRVQELRHFQEVLRKADPITHVLLSEWVSSSDSRSALLAGGVWGGIRWPKGLGKPKTPSITGGFSVVHEFWKIDAVDTGGGHYIDKGRWKTQPAPSVWDASPDSEYRVAFFFFAGLGGINPNRLTVSLAHVSWDISLLLSPGTLRLDPYGFGSFGSLGERIVFPDFEVKHEPYRRDRSIQPLGPAVDSDLFKQSST